MAKVETSLDANAPRPSSSWRGHPVAEIVVFAGITAAIFCLLALPIAALYHLTHTSIDRNGERGGLTVKFCFAIAVIMASAILTNRKTKVRNDAHS